MTAASLDDKITADERIVINIAHKLPSYDVLEEARIFNRPLTLEFSANAVKRISKFEKNDICFLKQTNEPKPRTKVNVVKRHYLPGISESIISIDYIPLEVYNESN